MVRCIVAVCLLFALIAVVGRKAETTGHAVRGAVAQQTAVLNELQCLSENIYYEAGVEPTTGKYAVAQVTMNRLRSGRWGNTVCSVVHSPKQFSWTLNKVREVPRGAAWVESQKIAKRILSGYKVHGLSSALYYHATYVKPHWRKKSAQVAKIGQHIFYHSAKIQTS